MLDARILLVDDNLSNILFLENLLEYSGYRSIKTTTDPEQVLPIFLDWRPNIILLDLHMPKLNGYQVMALLKENGLDHRMTPVLVFTADATADARKEALEHGASDFLTKPGEATEILLRVRNFLRLQNMFEQLADQNSSLESLVFERTLELQQAQEEIVHRLARAAEYRDDQTGGHARRVGKLSSLIGAEMGLKPSEVRMLELAATLHDIGKIGIPDAILLKEGRLTNEEFEQMRFHAGIGGNVLSGSKAEVLRMAEQIALSHHERWDGQGYPEGLAGENIPLYGRIVCVADSYDALVSERPYKAAMPRDEAIEEIERCSGSQFDPAVVEVFKRVVYGFSQSDITLDKAS